MLETQLFYDLSNKYKVLGVLKIIEHLMPN